MEKFQQLRESSIKRLKLADHLLTITFPLVKDPKILIPVIENLYYSFENGMNSILEHEKLFKKISVLPTEFEPRLRLYEGSVVQKLNLNTTHINSLVLLRRILEDHKDSPVEFSKGDKFIICDDNYQIKTLSFDKIKDHVKIGKEFLESVKEVVQQNERIFRRS